MATATKIKSPLVEIYQGRRTSDGTCEILSDGKRLHLWRSLAVWNHSPTGFEWGYAGSGPAQSALAILLDFTEGKRNFCERFHQVFKECYLIRVKKPGWILKSQTIQRFITMITQQEAALGRALCEMCLCLITMHSELGRCWNKGCACGIKKRQER
jgi:hypothetical protein